MSKKKKRNRPLVARSPAAKINVAPKDFWAGPDGTDYTKRNRVDWTLRLPFWQRILDATNAASFLEVGMNAGWNFEAIRKLAPEAVMSGVDLNEDALREALAKGLDVEVLAGDRVAEFFGAGACELSFTSGVLIHVPPEDLVQTMAAIRDVSSQYVLAVEYHSDYAQAIEYRGREGLLWKRDYGKLYVDMGLSLVETGAAEGFDDCRYYLLEK